MKDNEKVMDELCSLGVFFAKARTKLTLHETVHKAEWLISKIETEIKPGQKSENRIFSRRKKYLAALISVQNRCAEVFDSNTAAENWLKSKIIALGGETPLEVMASEKGFDLVLKELSRIEQSTNKRLTERGSSILKLEDHISKINNENIHGEAFVEGPVGKEIW